MDKEELIQVAQGNVHFNFQSIIYSLALCLLGASLFIFDLSGKLQIALLLCIIALFSSFVYYNLHTRLNAALQLVELSSKTPNK